MKGSNFNRLISITLCIAIVILACPAFASLTAMATAPANSNDIAEFVEVGENLYSYDGATEQIDTTVPNDWTQLTSSNCNWLWNPGGTVEGTTQADNGGPGVNINSSSASGAIVFSAPNTADYVLSVRFRIAQGSGAYGLMTNIADPLSSATGATLSYISLTTSNDVTTGTVTQYNRQGGGQYDSSSYTYSEIGNSGSASIYPGAIVTLKAYSFKGSTYFYVNDELVAYGAQRNPETIKSLCGVYTSGAKLRIVAVSIDALQTNDIRTKVFAGKTLYSFEGATEAVADAVPTGWTQMTDANCSWLWQPGGTLKGKIEQNNGGNGVVMSNESGNGGVVFPSINTSNYVLTVKIRIGREYGSYGLMTNIADPIANATGATLSYISLSTSDSVTTGSAVQYNRVGSSQYDRNEYAYDKIGNSGSAPIYPGAVVTMEAYSYNGYTYYYIDDEFVSYGKQYFYDPDKSLCGVYASGTTLKIIDVNINEAVSRDITERATVGSNLYSYNGATEQTDTTVPSNWTQLTSSNCTWLWNTGSTVVGTTASNNGGPGVNLTSNSNGAGGVVFPSVNTSNYVLTVKFRIASDHGSYGLMTNIADPISNATGTTLSYITLPTGGAVAGTATQYNRVGNGQYDITEYEYSKAGSTSSTPYYPGAIVTMKVYSFNGCTYYYIKNDDSTPKTSSFELLACGAQKDPNLTKSLCGVYCYNTTLRITAVSIDALNAVIPENTIADFDFEDDSYTVGAPNCDGDQWSVEYDSGADNHYLQRAAGNSAWYSWGFTLPNTELLPGRTYKVSFKARSNKNVFLDYSVLSSGAYTSFCPDIYYIDKNSELLTANTWKSIETYITAKDDTRGRNAYFRILTMLWNGTVLDFDDIVIEEVQGMSFCEYGNKYAKPHIVEEDGATLTALPGDPEREGYIFNGWYLDGAALTTGTTVKGYKKAYANWTAAVTSKNDISNITTTGTTNLGLTVTNANAYPVNFTLAMSGSGSVKVSIFTGITGSSSTAKSVVWERTFTTGGDIGALIKPNTIKSGSTTGNRLYVTVSKSGSPTFTISNFVIGAEGAPTARTAQFDVDGDGSANIIDLIVLKRMAASGELHKDKTWLADIDDNGFIATADDMTELIKGLLGSNVTATKYGRDLVWNEEFNGNSINTEHFKFPYDSEGIYSTDPDNIKVSGGNLNINVTRADGYSLAKPASVNTDGKLSMQYGYLEIRAKASLLENHSTCFWLYSGNTGDHSGNYGEVDILESDEYGDGFRPNIHVWDWENGRIAQYSSNFTKYTYSSRGFNKTEYHIYGFEWDANGMKFYVDGTLIASATTAQLTAYNSNYGDIMDDFYCLRMSNTMFEGLGYYDALPTCSIDYIRLYQKSGEQYKINGVIQ
ncbi:MAG: family 16 glycosylhydrolase [Clostridia bacterium]|nr:family 16 glycosylhydrolase [Clostridia bacterium]